jgi:hypothetical protein
MGVDCTALPVSAPHGLHCGRGRAHGGEVPEAAVRAQLALASPRWLPLSLGKPRTLHTYQIHGLLICITAQA